MSKLIVKRKSQQFHKHHEIYNHPHFESCVRLTPDHYETHTFEGWKGALMNPLPCCGSEYVYTFYEQLCNILTHLLGVVMAIFGVFVLLKYVELEADPFRKSLKYYSALVFGLGMIVLFSVSCLYHSLCLTSYSTLTYIFRLGDHAVIYLFIAASYTPWLELVGDIGLDNEYGHFLNSLIWKIALFGIFFSMVLTPFLTGKAGLFSDGIYKSRLYFSLHAHLPALFSAPDDQPHRHPHSENLNFKVISLDKVQYYIPLCNKSPSNMAKNLERIELVLYLSMGWVIITIVEPILNHQTLPSAALVYLAVGGIFYTTGVFFFVRDGRIPCAHAIWHVFVVLGATFHFFGILKYLIM